MDLGQILCGHPMTESATYRRVLCLGQAISLCITLTSVCTQELTLNYGVQLAATQSVGNYFLLMSYLAHRWWIRESSDVSETPWWKYMLVAFADVEANFLVVLAYKYTTISSAMLLDCFTLPVVMYLSITFLHAKYAAQHYVGVSLCLIGIAFLITSDILSHRGKFTTDSFNATALFGDLLSLLGATIYGVSNVSQEYFVKTKSRSEFLGNLGLYGFIICSCQAYWYERHDFLAVTWTSGSVVFLSLYVLALFLMYSITAIMLRDGDSAIFNMSLLTSDFFGVLAGVYLFHQSLSWLYCIGFVSILAGLVVYTRAPPPTSVSNLAPHPDDPCLRLLPDHIKINEGSQI
ncbi:hypothetical protein AeRB84_005051 [Aphanomyces euteiches]|nr:hypothetical protein AeRB84_005051 [Aphanomyces euteiches]